MNAPRSEEGLVAASRPVERPRRWVLPGVTLYLAFHVGTAIAVARQERVEAVRLAEEQRREQEEEARALAAWRAENPDADPSEHEWADEWEDDHEAEPPDTAAGGAPPREVAAFGHTAEALALLDAPPSPAPASPPAPSPGEPTGGDSGGSIDARGAEAPEPVVAAPPTSREIARLLVDVHGRLVAAGRDHEAITLAVADARVQLAAVDGLLRHWRAAVARTPADEEFARSVDQARGRLSRALPELTRAARTAIERPDSFNDPFTSAHRAVQQAGEATTAVKAAVAGLP